MLVFFRSAMVSQLPNSLRNGNIVCDDSTAVATSAKVLRRIKAEARNVANGSDSTPVIAGAVRLSRVFDNSKSSPPGYFQNRIHIGRLSVKMNRNDGFGLRGDVFLDLSDIDIVGTWIDVGKNGFRPRMHHSFSSCYET